MIERKHKFLIQRLAAFAFEAGTELLLSRVNEIAQFLVKRFPHNAKHFLDYFEVCLKKVYAKRFATVEFAGALNFEKLKQILRSNNRYENCEFVLSEAPELIGGFKVTQADDVLDFSLKAQLNELINILK